MLQHDELMLHEKKKKTAYLYIRAFEFFSLDGILRNFQTNNF